MPLSVLHCRPFLHLPSWLTEASRISAKFLAVDPSRNCDCFRGLSSNCAAHEQADDACSARGIQMALTDYYSFFPLHSTKQHPLFLTF